MELGETTLVIALILSVYAIAAHIFGIWKKKNELFDSARIAIIAIAVLLTIASIWLFNLFITRNFQYEYVALYSSLDLPMVYTISAFWAGADGSLLLWAWLIAIYIAMIAVRGKSYDNLIKHAMPVILVTLAYFLYMMLTVSRPFRMLDFIPVDGNGLNPLLQDPGMLFHPTTLFWGYAGAIIPFALMIAGIYLADDTWTYRARRWALWAWLGLTLGNMFGSYWAYTVLNWGGFWGWDPVENASFLPWLTLTAFYHSTMIQERKGGMKFWNILLILLTWELVVYGTLLTRSGIISSVHTFGESTTAPYYINYMIVVLAATLILVAWKYNSIQSKKVFESFVSREASFLYNNWIFMASTASVLWGTTYPLLSEAFRGYKVMVGPSFYNQVNVPLGIALLFLMGICPLIAWRRASVSHLQRNFTMPLATAVGVTAIAFVFGIRDFYAQIVVAGSVLVIATHLVDVSKIVNRQKKLEDRGYLKNFSKAFWNNRRTFGGYLCHIAILMIIVSAAGAVVYEKEGTFNMRIGDTSSVGSYEFQLTRVDQYMKSNRQVTAALFDVYKNGELILTDANALMYYYARQDNTNVKPMAYRIGLDDLYFSAQAITPDHATLKIKVMPVMFLMWLGGFYVLILGILICVSTVIPIRQRRLSADINVKESMKKMTTESVHDI
ncbi:cytochrome c biogenesis factor [Candidatus Methanoperedens nitroreducens]|uniref:Cytochrome c biogenesis factor n=1 Tax=Candidatus Methanoperedens nitratireducens TaxID=1392998 RepID=A0A062V506_9EURY|nr:cytochrome c-type biogenesis CcmF C-terminal domain-containing protein [Candidatus Methanoperedens nitroreducens]KCZ72397.1 cytochrome c biogenesis factor [Candidatus Methanoperedens nitroreducens]MDJ1423669.1 cytochrome c-type biogenesis CcmF C-terminal domain-containing protein [Candidatus Methanoperedens sp.]